MQLRVFLPSAALNQAPDLDAGIERLQASVGNAYAAVKTLRVN